MMVTGPNTKMIIITTTIRISPSSMTGALAIVRQAIATWCDNHTVIHRMRNSKRLNCGQEDEIDYNEDDLNFGDEFEAGDTSPPPTEEPSSSSELPTASR